VGDVITVADIERFRRIFSGSAPPIDGRHVISMKREYARHLGTVVWADVLERARRHLAGLRVW
jgi:hypothetical protein